MNSRIRNLVEELGIVARFTDKLEDDYKWKRDELDNISSNIKRLQKKEKIFLLMHLTQINNLVVREIPKGLPY